MPVLLVKRAWFIVLAAALVACGGIGGNPPSQRWGDLIVQVETRPAPVRPGMNEILVTLTDTQGRAGNDVRVAMRMHDDEPWKQLIQDGLSGVFRRAIKAERGDRFLQVELNRGEKQQVLNFPLGEIR